jgi:carboxyl-terminal processing protease
MPSTTFTFRNALYAACILVLGMFLGFKMKKTLRATSGVNSGNEGYVSEIMQLVSSNYVDKITTDSITAEAIENVLAKLDPHSVYIPPEDLQGVDEDMEGSFDGIGIEFFINKDTLTVTSVIAGGPSEDAGLLTGDKIISVNDSSIAGTKISSEKIIKIIRGRSGTKVKLDIIRSNKLLKNLIITRGKIPMYSIDAAYMLDSKIGYIKINRFSATTYNEFMDKMYQLKKEGMVKLVLDLRDNPGGYLDAATNIADEIIAGHKKLVYTKGVNKSAETYFAEKKGIFETGAIAVLIDEGSASASEILSGVVQDYDRGTIIGRRSFGKGLVQEQFPLSNGGALRLTVARYYIPSGRSIQKDYSAGIEDYRKDLLNRFDNGELVAADTIIAKDTTVYKTEKGRVVRGGGGITPDIFVPLDTTKYSKNAVLALSSGTLTEAISTYYNANLNTLKAFKSIEAFKNNFNDENGILKNWQQVCQRDTIGVKAFNNPKDVIVLKTRAKAQLAKVLYGLSAYYHIINAQDAEILKSIQTLK